MTPITTATNTAGPPITVGYSPLAIAIMPAASAQGAVFTSASAATAAFGAAFTFTVTTTGDPAPRITKTGQLPSAVRFADNGDGTATISGTPGKAAAGVYPLALTARNKNGTATQAFTLTVTRAPAIRKIRTIRARAGAALHLTLRASGYPAPALAESGPLPGGLTFTGNGNGTAVIAGTSAAGSSGRYRITITATNASGQPPAASRSLSRNAAGDEGHDGSPPQHDSQRDAEALAWVPDGHRRFLRITGRGSQPQRNSGRFCQFEPVLSYRKRRAIDELHYDSATKVLLEFKTRFWEQGLGGFTGGGCVSDSANRFTYFPSHVPGSPGGVVLASYTWSDEAMRWDALTLDERCYFALRNMADMFGPQVYTQFTGVGATQSWARARYALGEAVIFTPGQLHEHHLATATVEGRAHFAGDHTSMKAAWIEGALESAVRSALEVTARA